MKILSIFIDMLRPNLMNIVDHDRPESPFDRYIREMGGNLFVNCHTPAPDTGRSLACLWSGKYPKNNGCDKRIKYPRFFLKDEHHFLKALQSRGYDLNFYVNPNEKELGVLPEGFESIGYHNSDMDLNAFTENLVVSEKSFTFISLTDFHWAIDDYGNIESGVQRGFQQVCNSLGLIQRNLNFDQFDLIVIFSDHGFKLAGEFQKQPKYKLLNADRSQIFMLTKTKGENNLTINSKFCSIMDLAPTFLEAAEVLSTETRLDGVSLFSPKSYDHLVLEDHLDFAPRINQVIELWAVRTGRGVYYRTLDRYIADEYEGFQSEEQISLDRLIADTSSFFAESLQEQHVLAEYEKLQQAHFKTFFTDGTKRKSIERNPNGWSGKKIIVFGTGAVGKNVSQRIIEPIAYYVDNNSEKWESEFLGKTVKNPSTLIDEDKQSIAVIVASTAYFHEISHQLEDMGFKEEEHFFNGQHIPQANEVSDETYYCNKEALYLTDLHLQLSSVPGMITEESGKNLFAMAFAQDMKGDIVEIGSWQGKSTIYLGKAAEAAKNGKVYAVDHFKGNPGKESHYKVEKDDLSDLKGNFLRNVESAGVADYIELLNMPSDAAADVLRERDCQIRLLFIDGCHTYDGVKNDFLKYYDLVQTGGLIVFDDYSLHFEGVVRFIKEWIDTESTSRYFYYKNTFVMKK